MGRDDLDCATKVAAIERVAQSVEGPIVIVAHSGGCIMVAHWAQRRSVRCTGALLAAPPDFEQPMPEGYPHARGDPRRRLAAGAARAAAVPAASSPRAATTRSPATTASPTWRKAWGSELVDLGEVGHLNPASGYGEWPRADFAPVVIRRTGRSTRRQRDRRSARASARHVSMQASNR